VKILPVCKRIKAKFYENEDVFLEISKRDTDFLKTISIISITTSLLVLMVISLILSVLLHFLKFNNMLYISLIIFLPFVAVFLGTFLFTFRFGEIPLTLRASPNRGIVELRLLKPRNREIVKCISIKELSELIVKSFVSQTHIKRGGEGNHRVVVLFGKKKKKLCKLFVAGPELARFAKKLSEKLHVPLKIDFKNVITSSEIRAIKADNNEVVSELKSGKHAMTYISRPMIYETIILTIAFSFLWWLLLLFLASFLLLKGTVPEVVGLILIIPAVILGIPTTRMSLKIIPTEKFLLKLSGSTLHISEFLGRRKIREFYVPLSGSHVEEINVLCFGKLQGEPRHWVEIVGKDNIAYIPVTNKSIAVSLAQFLKSYCQN